MKPLLLNGSKHQKSVTIEVEASPSISVTLEEAATTNAIHSTCMPSNGSGDKFFADQYSCRSPPVFIFCVTLVEFLVFAYDSTVGPITPINIDSPFIYRPDRRYEVWRFLLYMLLHAGWVHLLINLSVQLVVGLPLELVHGSWRIGCIYMSGVLAGSLSTSVFDSEVYLIGASGGVYALLTTHLANVILNHRCMQFAWMRVVGVVIIAGSDVGFAVYHRYMEPQGLPVSYIAHVAGASAGLTAGLLMLRNFERKFHEHLLWWTALVVYVACILFAVLYNVFNIEGIVTPAEILKPY
ncbi:protein rhomboid-like [Varroa jacobsoni]|uniref:rhomboid protease n=1 Tax=Varroa destructor TaxID=109461 RepID=A0A7M7KBD0_VARDE|nr:protein rhomboid-like [Varroa destructor]XP_022664383.1 protein rhomboid-like [Varroa destructor]XP_022664384.1 protein rhomboid-like [Varroa destructor]XP_022690208.1 protein rhomboid-like [Varroa jacobsoni]XP_022690209.1 protein rhomboid-like [Varroa jacobsoni]XP_022690210.1 protein rhomboid-like [Varroa jacobsoni]